MNKILIYYEQYGYGGVDTHLSTLINGWKNIGTKEAILANCSDIEHEKGEMKRIDPIKNNIPYKWDIVLK